MANMLARFEMAPGMTNWSNISVSELGVIVELFDNIFLQQELMFEWLRT